MLTPFSIGGLSDPSLAPLILSFFYHRTADLQRIMMSEKTVGECSIVWFIHKYGYKFKLSRPDFVSNRQYAAALQAIYTKYVQSAPPSSRPTPPHAPPPTQTPPPPPSTPS